MDDQRYEEIQALLGNGSHFAYAPMRFVSLREMRWLYPDGGFIGATINGERTWVVYPSAPLQDGDFDRDPEFRRRAAIAVEAVRHWDGFIALDSISECQPSVFWCNVDLTANGVTKRCAVSFYWDGQDTHCNDYVLGEQSFDPDLTDAFERFTDEWVAAFDAAERRLISNRADTSLEDELFS